MKAGRPSLKDMGNSTSMASGCDPQCIPFLI